MASKSRRKNAPVTEQLQSSSGRFEFFQAVRLLELSAQWYNRYGKQFAHVSVAKGAPPNRESVRFKA